MAHSTMLAFSSPSASTGSRTRTGGRSRNPFPDLEPVISEVDRRHKLVLSARSVKDEPTEFTKRAEASDGTAKLTVYALNGVLLILAFPVGFGMLIFNLLGGENLRTTAHMIALSGLGTALNISDVAAPFIA